jgi:GT2 family glycosyltransferase
MIIECISSLITQSIGKSKLEVLVVYDTDCNTDYLNKVLKLQSEKVAIKCIGYEPPFNFSKKCNLGASHASGEVVVFLNDDTWWRSSDALLELAGSAMIDGVGAAGAKLFFENGRLQHAGYILRGGFVGHAYFKDVDGYGPFADLIATHEVVGVTGACLAQKRSIWESVGRWDEALPAAYNDVDYCFRIRDSELSILQVNSARLFHYESITRNPTVRPEETKLILDRWQHDFGEEQFFRQAATVPEARYLRGTFFQEYSRYVQTTYKHQGVSGVLMLFVNKIKKFMN